MKRTQFVVGILLVAVALVGTLRQSFSFIVGGILAFLGVITGLGIEISRSEEPDQSPVSPYSEPSLRLKEPTGRETEAQTLAVNPLKKARDCDCACHRGAVIVHIVRCCDAPVPIVRPQSPKPPT